MSTMLSVMGQFFASYRLSSQYCLLTLITSDTNPAIRCIRQQMAYLSDSTHRHWDALRCGREWSSDLYHRAGVPTLVSIGSLLKRFVLALMRWPWRLGLLLDRNLGDAAKTELAEEFFECAGRPCCVDEVSLKVKEIVGSAEELTSPWGIKLIEDLFDNTPLTNIGSEQEFAGAHARHQANHGNCDDPTTFAADHVLAEAKIILDGRLQSFLEKRARAARFRTPTLPRSRYHKFTQVKRKEGLSFADISKAWDGLSADEQAAFDIDPAQVPPALDRQLRAPLVWPCANDDCYPLSCEHVEDVAKDVSLFSRQWDAKIGRATIHEAAHFDAPPKHVCEETLGRKRCRNNVDMVARLPVLDECRKKLHRWCKITRAAPTKFNEVYKPLQMFYLGPAVAPASSTDIPRGRLGLVIYAECGTFAWVVLIKPSFKPTVGDVANFEANFDTLLDHVSCSWLFHDLMSSFPGDVELLEISYKQVGLLSYEITGMEDTVAQVPEGSLADFCGRHRLALELVCGANFSWKLMCGAGPGDLRESGGRLRAKTTGKTVPKVSSLAAFRNPGYQNQRSESA